MGTTSAYGAGAVDDLDSVLEAFDRDRSYTTQRLLKENELERTELVADAVGRRFIRKYIVVDAGREHPYERLRRIVCPNLQRVCETARIAGRLAVVCEFVDGSNLRDYIAAHGRLGEAEAVRLLRDVCAALRVLHSLDGGPVIHRDVNPGNIIVSGGRAVLVDLGIARSQRAGAQQDTRSWGTRGYAAPEQFGFQQTDARADIYSLGRVLVYMLTGSDPGPSGPSGASAAMRSVCEKATRLDPADRFQSVSEFCSALDRALGGRSVMPQRPDRAARAGFGERVRGATRRSKVVLVLWRIWQFYAVLYAAGGVGAAFVVCQQPHSPVSYGAYIYFFVACFSVPLLMSANFLNVNDRIPWLGEHRYRKLALLWGAAWLLFVAYAAVAAALGIPIEPYLPSGQAARAYIFSKNSA